METNVIKKQIGTLKGEPIYATMSGDIVDVKGDKFKYSTYDNTYNFAIDDEKVKGKIVRRNVGTYIARAFIDNPYNVTRITFIDGDSFNTNPLNLKWMDYAASIEAKRMGGVFSKQTLLDNYFCRPSFKLGDSVLFASNGDCYTYNTNRKGYIKRTFDYTTTPNIRIIIDGVVKYTAYIREMKILFGKTYKNKFSDVDIKYVNDSDGVVYGSEYMSNLKQKIGICHRYEEKVGLIYVTEDLRFFIERGEYFLEVFSSKTKLVAQEYPYLVLPSTGGRIRTHLVVADAFCGKASDNERKIVNHIDGDKTNYKHSNLEYISQKENVAHAINNGLRVGIVEADRIRVFEFMSKANNCTNHGVSYFTGMTVSYVKDLRKKPQWADMRAQYPKVYYGRSRFPLSEFEINLIKQEIVKGELDMSTLGKFFKGKLYKVEDGVYMFENIQNCIKITI